jgi:hypothetical protein
MSISLLWWHGRDFKKHVGILSIVFVSLGVLFFANTQFWLARYVPQVWLLPFIVPAILAWAVLPPQQVFRGWGWKILLAFGILTIGVIGGRQIRVSILQTQEARTHNAVLLKQWTEAVQKTPGSTLVVEPSVFLERFMIAKNVSLPAVIEPQGYCKSHQGLVLPSPFPEGYFQGGYMEDLATMVCVVNEHVPMGKPFQ